MGNNLSRKKTAKIMKTDGQIFKLKLPVKTANVLKNYPPNYVLLESESVKRFGIRAPKLRPEEELRPKRIYFLVDMPRFPDEEIKELGAKRVGSEGRAHERLEWLALRRDPGSGGGSVRVRIRVPKAQIVKLMEEGGDEADMAERIVLLCMQEHEENKKKPNEDEEEEKCLL